MDELDFNAVATGTIVDSTSSSTSSLMVVCTIVLYLGLVLATARAARRFGSSTAISLRRLGGSHRALAALVLINLLLAQAGGATTAYLHTHELHGSTAEYIRHVSTLRLAGMSHSHLFGFAILNGVLGLLLSFSSMPERARCLVIAAILWAGPFDIGSWWGIKQVSSDFEWLTIFTGSASGIGSLVAFFAIGRDLIRGEEK